VFVQSTQKVVKRLVSMVLLTTLLGVFLAPMAFAKIAFNTIDLVATVTDNGRQLLVTGPVACTQGESAHLRVTVTQRSTGAVAEGRTIVDCTGVEQQWEVFAPTQGNETFEEGPATAVAIDYTTSRGVTTDAHQWLVNITLVGE
jgi:hypothetical protein